MRSALASTLFSVFFALPAASQETRFDALHRMAPASDAVDLEGVAWVDVDGDGDLDAFLGDAWDPVLFVNRGNGVLDESSSVLPPLGAIEAIAFGDVDADGDEDFFAAGAPSVFQWENDGSGTFLDRSSKLPASSNFGQDVALADIDGDGHLDAIVAVKTVSSGDAPEEFYLGDGTGCFTDASALLPSAPTTTSVAVGDVDQDGDLDVFFGTFEFPVPDDSLFLNDGVGGFVDGTAQLLQTGSFTNDAAFADLDADGDLDLALACALDDRVLQNDGAGTFTHLAGALPPKPPIVPASHSVAVGDLDGDTSPDLVFGQRYGLAAFANRGGATFGDISASLNYALREESRCVALGDADRDGDLDLLAGQAVFGHYAYLLSDGTGGWIDANRVVFPSPTVEDPTHAAQRPVNSAAVDLDGDEDLDVVVGEGDVPVWINDGAGFFSEATRLQPDGTPTFAAATADMDLDGDLDVVTGTSLANRLFLNDGSAGFAEQPGIIAQTNRLTYEVVIADYDQDGTPDPFFANNGRNGLALSDNGVWLDEPLPNLAATSFCATAADFDRDGDVDVLVGNSFSGLGNMRFYRNPGDGALFVDGGLNPIPNSSAVNNDMESGDLDGDGDVDVVASRTSGIVNRDTLLLNEFDGPAASFVDQGLPPNSSRSQGLALFDADEDGDLDIVFAIVQPKMEESVLLNDGSAGFAKLSPTYLPRAYEPTVDFVTGDFDGDGDEDWIALKTEGVPAELVSNVTRQLAWQGLPRLRLRFSLALQGPPNETWILASSPGRANVSVPPFGTLYLDPGALSIFASGVLDAEGEYATTFRIPNQPALIDQTFWLQGLMDVATNLERLRITAF